MTEFFPDRVARLVDRLERLEEWASEFSGRIPAGSDATTKAAAGGIGVPSAGSGGGGSLADHTTLSGLDDDDHAQYALLAGRSGGQSLIGGTGAGDDLTLKGSSNATPGTVKVGGATTDLVGFYGNTGVAQPSAYTQTYATADKTLSAYTPDDESAAYTGIDNAQAGTVYATVADLNALRTAYENLRALTEDLAAFVNSIVDDLQSLGQVA